MPLGLEDGRIANALMSASSYYNNNLGPWNGRLQSRRSWSAKRNNRNQWLKVDLGAMARITGVATQGRQDRRQWVKTYSVSYSKNGFQWNYYKERARTKVRHFTGCMMNLLIFF